jgi:hypothetical protein
MVWQSWSATKAGAFSDAANWGGKAVPTKNAVISAQGKGDIQIAKEQ